MSWDIRCANINKTIYVSIDDLIIGLTEDKDNLSDTKTIEVLSSYIKEFKRVKKENNEV